jgi:hypothetical protein
MPAAIAAPSKLREIATHQGEATDEIGSSGQESRRPTAVIVGPGDVVAGG